MKKIGLYLSTAFLAVLFLSGCIPSGAKEKSNIEPILEEFCETYYTDCFSNREYVKYTLHVEEIEKIGHNPSSYGVSGTHTYIGTFGQVFTDMPFKAMVTYMDAKGVEKHIKFYKYSKAGLLDSEDYWEMGEKIMIDRKWTNY